MITSHRIKHRVIAAAWIHAEDNHALVVVDCGKGLPPAVDSLVTIVTASPDGSETAEAWRVRKADQWCGGTRYGLTVTKATVEDLAAARTGTAWQAGSRIPADRDVWASIYNYETTDIELLRGRDDDGDFMPPGKDWTDLHTGSVLCWIDAEERPSFSVETVIAGIAAMEAPSCDQGAVEGWLHREALRAVASGHPDTQAIAAAALESLKVKFTRYYS